MYASPRPIVLAASLGLAGWLAIGNAPARAQSPVAPRPGYYYSPGGYSGGYYHNPGYYANPRPRVAIPAPAHPPSAVARSSRRPKYIEDWSTGRTNYPLPLTKPWMRPLQ